MAYSAFLVWLISLIIRPSRSIRVVTNGNIIFFLMAEWCSIIYMTYLIYHISSFIISIYCFHILAIMNYTIINIRVKTSLWILFSFPLSTYPDVALFLFFLENLHTVFHNAWTSLQFHHQYTRILFSPYPRPILVISCLFHWSIVDL